MESATFSILKWTRKLTLFLLMGGLVALVSSQGGESDEPPRGEPAAPAPAITLVVCERKEGVLEVNRDGKVLWSCQLPVGPYDAEPVAGGGYAVGLINQHCVVVIDRSGKEVRRLVVKAWPMDVDVLKNGNFLVARLMTLGENKIHAVTEYDAEGEVVWEYMDLKSPNAAQRLENGNTLIADTGAGRVIEVDPKGAVVWKVEGLKKPVDVQRLAGGNTLVAMKGENKVVELDREGKAVWEASADNPYSARRLANGNTLVTERRGPKNGRVVELDRGGKIVWESGPYVNLVKAYRLEKN